MIHFIAPDHLQESMKEINVAVTGNTYYKFSESFLKCNDNDKRLLRLISKKEGITVWYGSKLTEYYHVTMSLGLVLTKVRAYFHDCRVSCIHTPEATIALP